MLWAFNAFHTRSEEKYIFYVNLLPCVSLNGLSLMVRCFFRLPSLVKLASLKRLLPG